MKRGVSKESKRLQNACKMAKKTMGTGWGVKENYKGLYISNESDGCAGYQEDRMGH